jgi:hypothetical protein
MWVPDTRDPDYTRRIKAQCIALKNDPAEHDALAWAEAAALDIAGWR